MFVVNYPPRFTLQLIKREVITMYIVQLLVLMVFMFVKFFNEYKIWRDYKTVIKIVRTSCYLEFSEKNPLCKIVLNLFTILQYLLYLVNYCLKTFIVQPLLNTLLLILTPPFIHLHKVQSESKVYRPC